MRSVWMALIVLCYASCDSPKQGCNFAGDTCHDDFDCEPESICTEESNGFGSVSKACVPATICSTDTDCTPPETCRSRGSAPADHPFEWTTPGKRVCVCF